MDWSNAMIFFSGRPHFSKNIKDMGRYTGRSWNVKIFWWKPIDPLIHWIWKKQKTKSCGASPRDRSPPRPSRPWAPRFGHENSTRKNRRFQQQSFATLGELTMVYGAIISKQQNCGFWWEIFDMIQLDLQLDLRLCVEKRGNWPLVYGCLLSKKHNDHRIWNDLGEHHLQDRLMVPIKCGLWQSKFSLGPQGVSFCCLFHWEKATNSTHSTTAFRELIRNESTKKVNVCNEETNALCRKHTRSPRMSQVSLHPWGFVHQ